MQCSAVHFKAKKGKCAGLGMRQQPRQEHSIRELATVHRGKLCAGLAASAGRARLVASLPANTTGLEEALTRRQAISYSSASAR